ncbi:hypothetical protein DAPPUDRAFT_301884 [Daphnia pulex]|uniref:Uncharacterized protein n=1 Tax=Daphnia pulex TaxID=6669 RepID=E9GB53_DAPPU|nr:hypothetical protein DAPPUDRAFT_301884 [Daphnia pulex]|eukprot:EFX83427.1 hypothetical protein DAPPUDRAFT_301884 [Daphnia pulex]
MCRAIRLLTLLACFLVAGSNPIEPADDQIFFLNLDSSEQSALMEMIVDAAGRVAVQRSTAESSMMTEIDMKIPEIVIQRMRNPDFDRQMLVRWIGRRWNLPDGAIADIVATGRGCSPRICLSISSRSTMEDNCCPLG